MNLSGAFLVFILLTFNTLGWGQPCHDRLSGVISGDAGDPLPNAVVTLADEGKQVITDLKGRFTFEGICPGNFKVVVSFIGYETAVLSVSVPADDPVLIAMTPSQTVLEDVTLPRFFTCWWALTFSRWWLISCLGALIS